MVAAAEAAGLDPAAPVAVLVAHRVVACSPAARGEGVRVGHRRREAQARCPHLETLPRQPDVEARAFEPVVAALEAVVPGVEVVRPGLALVAARGPVRFFGGEQAALAALAAAAAPHAPDVRVGLADGPFAAEQTARHGAPDGGEVVAPGGSAQMLAPLPIGALELDQPLAELFVQMGLHTLGDLAALPARDVLVRFGPVGAEAHRRAGARDGRPVAVRTPPSDLTATLELLDPVDRVDTMAFTASATVDGFLQHLAAQGLSPVCVELGLRAADGAESVRRWRFGGVPDAAALLDRVRWQLDGWRTGPEPPREGVDRLRLVPVETVPAGANQDGLWGGLGARDEQAHRAVARVQSLLGQAAVTTPVPQGGRTPDQRSRLVPWGDDPAPERPPGLPWPGALPPPAPAVLLEPPRPVRVVDARGTPVTVTARGAASAVPAALDLGRGPTPITGWAGPWPVDERWWDPAAASGRAALFQLVDRVGRAFLARCCPAAGDDDAEPAWTVDAIYD